MASRVPTRPVYQKGFEPRRPRVESESHLEFIRGLACCICLAPPPSGGSNDPMHVRASAPFYGKRETGGGERSDDKWTLPGCRRHHDEQHSENEMKFWRRHGIDPHLLALTLFGCSGNAFVAEQVIELHRRKSA